MEGILLPATLDSIAEVGRRVVALAGDAGLGPGECYRLRLATEEIVANVVHHGYPCDAGRAGTPTFEVSFGSDPERVWVCVVDAARPFDPTSVAAPGGLDVPLERRPAGGLGIHLARNALDEFSYRRDGARNRVTLGVCRRAGEEGRDGTPDGPDRR